MHGKIIELFDCYANRVVHLLLLKCYQVHLGTMCQERVYERVALVCFCIKDRGREPNLVPIMSYFVFTIYSHLANQERIFSISVETEE